MCFGLDTIRACLERRNHTGISQESIQFHRKNAGIGKNPAFQTGPKQSPKLTYFLEMGKNPAFTWIKMVPAILYSPMQSD